MSPSNFGPFSSSFETGELPVPAYLFLLNLSEPGVDAAIDRIQVALESTTRPQRWVDALFSETDWRPHLVGSIAVLLDRGARLDTAGVWRPIDSGSWVIPQLVVTAYFSDPGFPEHLVGRIDRRCDVALPSELSVIEQPVPTATGGAAHLSPKLLVSLLSMGARLPLLSSYLQRVSADPEYAALIEMDVDDAGSITNSWCKNIVAHFTSRRIELSPRAIETNSSSR
jgi:hypothetical protein